MKHCPFINRKSQAMLLASIAGMAMCALPTAAQTLVSGQPGFGKQWVRSNPFTIQGLSHSPSTWNWDEYFGVGMTMLNRDVGYNHPINPLNRPAKYAASRWQSFLSVPAGNPQAGINDFNNLRYTPYNAGWLVGDEPQTVEFADHATVAAYVRQQDPSQLVYTTGAHIQWGAESWYGNTSHPNYTYDNYWTDLNNAMNPDVLSYDFYSFDLNNVTQPRYLENIMFVRNKAKSLNKPYWGWMQSWGIGNARRPSESDLRFNVYTHLTAGYTGIAYWTYDNDPGGTGDGLIDSNGNPTPQYGYAAQTNAETQNLGKVLKMLESTDVRFVPGRHVVAGSVTAPNVTPSGMTNWSAGAGGDSHITGVSVDVAQVGLEKNGMIGLFSDDAGERYFMLTNLNHGQYLSTAAGALSFTLSFDSTINSILRLNRTTGLQELIYLTNNKFTWTLPGGTGDLFKYSTSPFFATGPGWGVNASGDWNIGANWGTGGIPNAVDATASFGTIITGARTIYTDLAVKVGALNFDSLNTYLLAGNGSLTIDVSSGSGQINVLKGSHKINLPLIFADNANVTVAGGATLTIGNLATIKANKVVTKIGNVVFQAPLSIEAGGSLIVGPGSTTLPGAPALALASSVNMQGGTLAIGYQGKLTPAETIRGQLASGYNGGEWNGAGINSSLASDSMGVGWRDDVDEASIQIQLAFYGDANLDGTVDSADFASLVANYGATGVWSAGDFNYDGRVNTLDFNHLAGNFGSVLAVQTLGTVVPEPAALCGIAFIAGLASHRTRPRRGR